jgi:hypothetical protein
LRTDYRWYLWNDSPIGTVSPFETIERRVCK